MGDGGIIVYIESVNTRPAEFLIMQPTPVPSPERCRGSEKYKQLKLIDMKQLTPKIGQFVYDPYYKVRRKVMNITCKGELFFIGSDHEPV